MNSDIKLFEEKIVRSVWDAEKDTWLFSVVDVCRILTDSVDGRKYWNKLKQRLKAEGNETVTNCHQLKMKAYDGKMRLTDVADTEQLLRIIQSIPSPKAEPFKMWLAMVGRERLDEIGDPELAFERAIDFYRTKGYSEAWITQRLKSIEIRKELTAEWQRSGIDTNRDYAILTNELTKAWSGLTTSEYKKHKDLKKENLRDNMTNLELVLNMLAEASTTEISKAVNPKGMNESKSVAREGGNIAQKARNDIESKTGKKVISKTNAKTIDVLTAENKE